MKFMYFMLRSAASDLCLHCLPMSVYRTLGINRLFEKGSTLETKNLLPLVGSKFFLG